MINIGINGFGRIGKSILHQSIKNQNIRVTSINFPDFKIDKIISYIQNDSFHKYDKLDVDVVNEKTIKVNNNIIRVLNKRTPEKDMWCGAKYVFETTGKFLTNEKAKEHDAEYFIMCAPAKDNTPQYLFNGNHLTYKGERNY